MAATVEEIDKSTYLITLRDDKIDSVELETEADFDTNTWRYNLTIHVRGAELRLPGYVRYVKGKTMVPIVKHLVNILNVRGFTSDNKNCIVQANYMLAWLNTLGYVRNTE